MTYSQGHRSIGGIKIKKKKVKSVRPPTLY